MRIRAIVNKYPVATFILLTFFISHVINPILVELLHIIFPRFTFNFPEAGLNERSLLNQYGGTIAASIITVKLYGTPGLKSMLRYSRINTKTIPWLFVSIILPLLLILLSYSLAGLAVEVLLTNLQEHLSFYLLVIAGFILSAGLGEEFGWRGFLLPQLLKTRHPLTATFITFIIITLWHFPALLSDWKGEPVLPWVILSFCIAVVHSWLFFKSNANLWVVILFHACFDAQYSFYSSLISDDHLPNTPFHQGWTYILLYCLLALSIIITTKGNLGYKHSRLNIERYFDGKDERPTKMFRHVG